MKEIRLYRVFTFKQIEMLRGSRELWDMDKHYSKTGVWLFNNPDHLNWELVNEALSLPEKPPLYQFALTITREDLGGYEDYSLADRPRRFLIPSIVLNDKDICQWRALSHQEQMEMPPTFYNDYPQGQPINAIKEMLSDQFRFILEDC